MDYGNLFKRAWDIIWNNKFLIILGILVALGSGGGSAGNSISRLGDEQTFQNPPFFNFGAHPFDQEYAGLAAGVIILLALVALLAGLVFWALSTVARGGLIYAAANISAGNTATFSEAFAAGWEKVLRLLGIGLAPAIPGFLIFLISGFSMVVYTGSSFVSTRAFPVRASNGVLIAVAIGLICVLGLATAVLALLRTFANRACMLEDLGVIDSYRRGFEILGKEFGSVLVLFLLQIAISVTIGIIFFVPSIVVSLCCLLWPLLLIVQGLFSAYYSTLWTLAWLQWTPDTAK